MKYFQFLFISTIVLLFSCKKDDTTNSTETSNTNIVYSSATSATDTDGNVYEVGYKQVTSTNQNPFVTKKDKSGAVIWSLEHENTPVDGRATLVVLDNEQNPIVVFTVDGGSNDAGYITTKEIEANAFKDVLFHTYGSGGGPRVAIVCKLNKTTGKIIKGTFFMSRTAEGNITAVPKTNSLEIKEMAFSASGIFLKVNSWFTPPSVAATASNYLFLVEATDEAKYGKAYWSVEYSLAIDFKNILTAKILN